MIYAFRFKNYFSFEEQSEVSFKLNRQVPDTDLLFETPRGARLSKVMAVVGANGSGKTNVLKSLAFLSDFARDSFVHIRPDIEIGVRPHFFSNDKNSEFEVEFELNGEHYRYSLVANPALVIHESLYRKTSKFFSYIFRRDWCDTNLPSYEVTQQHFGFPPSETSKLRQNASLIATAAQYNVPLAVEIANYFKRYSTNVRFFGRDHYDRNQLAACAGFYNRNEDLRERMSKIVSTLDLGISEVAIESANRISDTGVDMNIQEAWGIHRSDGREERLRLQDESSGTQVAFYLLRWILPVLEDGGILIWDELEADLHPELVGRHARTIHRP